MNSLKIYFKLNFARNCKNKILVSPLGTPEIVHLRTKLEGPKSRSTAFESGGIQILNFRL